jgi:hypothetical protein
VCAAAAVYSRGFLIWHLPRARAAGFEVADAVALLRLDDLYVECFEVKDVKQARRWALRALRVRVRERGRPLRA